MSNIELIIFAVVTLLSTIISATSGGGAGFILTPLAIFMGLTPQQTVATGKFVGLSAAVSGLRVLRAQKLHSRLIAGTMMVLAAFIGLSAPQLITRIDNDTYQKVLGFIILVMIPVLYIKKTGTSKKTVSRSRQKFGWLFICITLLGQAVLGGGVGTFVNLVLMSFFGMGALEAAITKRFSQVILNAALIIGLFGTGLIVWRVSIVAGIASAIGSHIGSKLAIKKGNAFVMNILMIAMLFSGVALLIGL